MKNSAQKRTSQIDFTKGKLIAPILAMTFPLFLSNLLQLLYNSADMMVVGKLVGDGALASVGATAYPTNLFLSLVFGLSTANNVICAKFFGANNYEKLKKSTHCAVLFSMLAGIVIGLIGIALTKPLLTITNTPEGEVLDGAIMYMVIFFAGMPFATMYNFGASMLMSIGDSKKPMYILCISGIVNVVLNVICVKFFDLGVAGVAIGTVASEFISVVLVYYFLAKTDQPIKVDFRKLKFDKYTIKELLRMGIPAALNGMTFQISNIVVQSAINSLGKQAMAGASAATNIVKITTSWHDGVQSVSISAAGQNMGAKKYSRLKRIFNTTVIMATVFEIAFALIILQKPIAHFALFLFVNEESAFDFAYIKLIVEAGFYFFIAPASMATGVMRGMGVANTPAIVNLFGTCVPRILWIYTVYRAFTGNAYVLFACYPISWLIVSAGNYFAMRIEMKHRCDPLDEVPDTP